MIAAASYTILEDGRFGGRGYLRVQGDSIEFYGGHCDGTGRYRWQVEDDALRFVQAGGDPCVGRKSIIGGITYVRSE